MEKVKRVRLIPANIATMTDSEHDAWVKALSDAEYEKVCERTFADPEYTVSTIDTDGEIIDNIWSADTLKSAVEYFDREASGGFDGECVALVLEKQTHHRRVIDRGDIQDSDFETMRTAGDAAALRKGGWIN